MVKEVIPELDIEDRDLYDYSWRPNVKGYLYKFKGRTLISLHQVIAYRILYPEDKEPGLKQSSHSMRVSHKDGYKKNNRRSNIRIRTHHEMISQMKYKHSSRFRDVHWSNTYHRWIAKVYYRVDGVLFKQHIGYYRIEDEDRAARDRDAWVLAHPQFFPNPILNFPLEMSV